MSNGLPASRYWARATVRPASTVDLLRRDPSKVAIAFWINLLFAALYTATVVIYTAIGLLSVAIFFVIFLAFMR